MNIFKVGLACVLASHLMSAIAAAHYCNSDPNPCGKPTAWNQFESVRLRLTQVGTPGVLSAYVQTSRQNGDMRVEIDATGPEAQHGTILLVGGRVFASTGLQLAPGAEMDALDAPLLYVILATKVLGRALPNGPDATPASKKFSYTDAKTGIQFATPSAEGFISPPWSAAGTVTPKPDQSVDFDFTLKWSPVDESKIAHPMEMVFNGSLKHDKDFRLDDRMSLKGWTVFNVGPIIEKSGSSTRYDYGAKPSTGNPQTIGDIRRLLATKQSAGQTR